MAYTDERGRVLDFHALRHTYITTIGRSGASAETVRTLARHASITTTQRYLHTSEDEQAATLTSLADLLPTDDETQARTGTDDRNE